MNVFDDRRQLLADKLTAAGPAVPVTLDPAGVPPMILVDVVTVEGAAGVGGWSSTIPIRLVVPPPGDAVAARALGDLLELTLRTLGAAPAAPGVLAVGAKDCPSYTVTYPADIPNPDC